MKRECRSFRRLLEEHLSGRPAREELTELSWHEHLLGCGPCRELLEHEEALEMVLASMPAPSLPPDLAARVLARLEAESLERLLDLDQAPVPAGLGARIRDGLRSRRLEQEHALDRLLERGAEVELPRDLARRVLAGLRAEREALAPSGLPALGPTPVAAGASRVRRVMLAAAALIFVTTLWATRDGAREQLPDQGLLANLYVLEHWDALREVNPLELDALAAFDVGDEALIAFAEEALGR